MSASVLDACCGGRMMWYDKQDPRALFIDHRTVETVLCDGRKFSIKPDQVADFTALPFPDNHFPLVVFDPPHLNQAGERSWLRVKYGVLVPEWKDVLAQGFRECFRVLNPLGTLIFKWNEFQIKLSDVLPLAGKKPLFGNRRDKTIWTVFLKEPAWPTKN